MKWTAAKVRIARMGPGIAYCSARREYEKEFEKGVGS
jgi:hypothetical protein